MEMNTKQQLGIIGALSALCLIALVAVVRMLVLVSPVWSLGAFAACALALMVLAEVKSLLGHGEEPMELEVEDNEQEELNHV